MTGRQHDTDKLDNHDYLARHGARLIANGYHITPIRAGTKMPALKDWPQVVSTSAQLYDWLDDGHGHDGVGIVTAYTPAIDIDVLDKDAAARLESLIGELTGGKLVRVGKAPKRLFLFRCDEPHHKMSTAVYEDVIGRKQQIEVLWQGQFFVAYGIHPDTKQPYAWTRDGQNPLTVPAADLVTLTVEMVEQVFALFDQVAKEEKWDVVTPSHADRRGAVDRDNVFVEDTASIDDMTTEQLRARLMLVPGADDYGIWYQVGMACHHQFKGSKAGLALWIEWSQTSDKFKPKECAEKWKTFDIEGKRRAPTTFRYVLELANEAEAKMAVEEGTRLRKLFDDAAKANSLPQWESAAKEMKRVKMDTMTRESIVKIASDAHQKITAIKLGLSIVRDFLTFTPEAPKGNDIPKWVRPWVYDTSTDTFYNTDTKEAVTAKGFDAEFNRLALTNADKAAGRSTPSRSASEKARDFYQVRIVRGLRYEPGQEKVFTDTEGTYANTYTERGIPLLPTKKTPLDTANVERVKAHIAHLLRDPREQRLLLDWLSWVVQKPGERMNYAVLLQGVDGDGKSFFADMLSAVIGKSNVGRLDATIFETPFTGWAIGRRVSFAEEVRIVQGHNKYDVLNKIKVFITNETIPVHEKFKAPRDEHNTVSYLLFSNHKDALPTNDNDRRYMILFSYWQRRAELEKFMVDNPDYYDDLYKTIKESPGAIREWLMNHKQHEDFKPKGRAPMTTARGDMIDLAKPEFIMVLDQVIEEGRCRFADESLIDVTNLPTDDKFISKRVAFPAPKAMGQMLTHDGYTTLGQVDLGKGVRARFWSKTPELFATQSKDGKWTTDQGLVRKHRERVMKKFDDEQSGKPRQWEVTKELDDDEL